MRVTAKRTAIAKNGSRTYTVRISVNAAEQDRLATVVDDMPEPGRDGLATLFRETLRVMIEEDLDNNDIMRYAKPDSLEQTFNRVNRAKRGRK